MSCRILSCVELLTCLTLMVNNSNVVSNTMYNSHLDYIVIVLSVLLHVEQMGVSAPQANVCSILRFWRKRKTQ